MTATNRMFAIDWADERMWIGLGMSVLRIAIIVLVAWIAAKLLHKMIGRLLTDRKPERIRLQPRRIQTVGKLLNNTVSYCIYFIAFLLILGEFNISLAPLLAGAGIVGLAIGFGAQSLVKDVISGLFIILEDPFGVGDEVKIGAYKGKVEMIGLRTTRIRSWTGEVHIIPNGQINDVTNYSLHNSLAVVDVPVEGDVSLERAMAVIGEAARQLRSDQVVREPEVLGVVAASASSATVRVVAECRPNTHEEVARSLNVLIRRALDELRAEPG
jgi:small conductance mechanosensitive channel